MEFRISTLILFPLLLLLFYESSLKKPAINTSPGARWGHVFMYDPINKNILLFGGTNERGGSFLDDTWIWDDGEWKQMNIPGPPARGFCAVAFHEKRKTIVLHGGRGNERVTYSDLCKWDGKKWGKVD